MPLSVTVQLELRPGVDLGPGVELRLGLEFGSVLEMGPGLELGQGLGFGLSLVSMMFRKDQIHSHKNLKPPGQVVKNTNIRRLLAAVGQILSGQIQDKISHKNSMNPVKLKL